jgi:hypothetical protein
MIEIREHVQQTGRFRAQIGRVQIADAAGMVAEYVYEDAVERRAALEDARDEATKLAVKRQDQVRDFCPVK